MSELRSDLPPDHPGVGGIVTDPSRIARLWSSIRATYQRQLREVRLDALAHYDPRTDTDQARYARAGELAMMRGGAAASRFMMSPHITSTLEGVTSALITDCHLNDPFFGLTVVQPSPTTIAWHSTCAPHLVEDSPLFEAIMLATERVQFPRGHGAIFTIDTDRMPETIWHAGDGKRLFSASTTAHTHS